MTSSELQNKIKRRGEIKAKLKEIEKIEIPPYPKKPIQCTIDEWKELIARHKAYEEASYSKGELKDDLEKELEENKGEIIKMLPCSNLWFLTDNRDYAVAHRSNDWPGSNGDLLIKEAPVREELPEIRHQIIN